MKTTTPKLNVKLLRKVQKWIREEPLRLRMAWWKRKASEIIGQPAPPCNTTHCIAGAAIMLAGKKMPKNDAGLEPAIKAAKLLGITANTESFGDTEAAKLFFFQKWPTQFKAKYTEEKTGGYFFSETVPLTAQQVRKNAKIADARIDYFIKHRE